MKRNKINWRVPKGMELTELDKKVLYYQDRGHLVPSRELIKTPNRLKEYAVAVLSIPEC